MPYVTIITILALLQFFWFGFAVGRARAKYNVPAPAMSGNEVFERRFRVHMNTLEQLVMFLPALWIFAHSVNPTWAAALGALYLVGRFIYSASYMRNPKSRGIGFGLTFLPTAVMLAWALLAAVRSVFSA
jgi:uncharacterized membrane protein YecN with MAPEG domain